MEVIDGRWCSSEVFTGRPRSLLAMQLLHFAAVLFFRIDRPARIATRPFASVPFPDLPRSEGEELAAGDGTSGACCGPANRVERVGCPPGRLGIRRFPKKEAPRLKAASLSRGIQAGMTKL